MKSYNKKRKTILQGKISIISTGGGFVSGLDLESDVFIPFQSLNTALHGDDVEIILLPQINNERPKGEVINILKRNKKRFVGVLEHKKGKNFSFLVADDNKMYVDILIPKTPPNAKNNNKVLVEITEWNNPKKNPEGKIIKVIGKKGDNNAEMESIVIEKGFEIGFSDEVEREAQEIKNSYHLKIKNSPKERRDMTNVLTFTIDPIDAKDFDDAISYKKISDNLYEIGVHIADVSYWVEEKSSIDKEAKKRGFSIYLPDRTIPMLPEVLSNDICSLNPGELKMTFSGVFKINSNGEIKDSWFGKTIIKSDKRFAYEEAQQILNTGEGIFVEELSELMEITRKMRKSRIDNGAMDIAQDEVKVEVDSNGIVKNIYVKEGIETQRLIEELMLLANREVAALMSDKKSGRVCVYRIHDKPDRDALKELILFLKKLGHEVEIKESSITSKDLNELLKSIEGTEEDFMVKSVVIRSMPKAIYSVEDKGHFALALKHYAHFTSPIRRYADLLVHRSLLKKIEGKKASKNEFIFYKETADLLSEREIDLSQAERESIAFKQVEFMVNKIGEVRRGIISGITNWGIYVSDIETRSEGMISLKEMKDDFYFFDKENFAIIGSKTKKKYSLGAKVKFKVLRGDVDQKKLEYSFV